MITLLGRSTALRKKEQSVLNIRIRVRETHWDLSSSRRSHINPRVVVLYPASIWILVFVWFSPAILFMSSAEFETHLVNSNFPLLKKWTDLRYDMRDQPNAFGFFDCGTLTTRSSIFKLSHNISAVFAWTWISFWSSSCKCHRTGREKLSLHFWPNYLSCLPYI